MLERALGYGGQARFVGFHWTPAGDEADYDDGQRAGTGEWQGYLAYIQHPAVYPFLTAYDFGSSDREAEHSLILDRQERTLFVATCKDTDTFLAQQWPKLPPVQMSQEEYFTLVTKVLQNVQIHKDIDIGAIQQRIEEQYRVVEDMHHWLNQFLPN